MAQYAYQDRTGGCIMVHRPQKRTSSRAQSFMDDVRGLGMVHLLKITHGHARIIATRGI